MGPAANGNEADSVIETTLRVFEKAGYEVVFPDKMNTLCCGTPWESKGFFDIADMKGSELESALLEVSNQGEYPVLCDTSPCLLRMKKKMTQKLRLFEPVEFIHDFLLNELVIKKREGKTAFHISCSSTKMDLEGKFRKVAGALSQDPVFPEEVGCCGFAGDKGFSHPELNDYALRNLKKNIAGCSTGFSNSRTCEIGLSKSAGINYNSIMNLLDECVDDMSFDSSER
jgi:D-lactate dehydrogenase